jgi:hypothetical protein
MAAAPSPAITDAASSGLISLSAGPFPASGGVVHPSPSYKSFHNDHRGDTSSFVTSTGVALATRDANP